MEESIKERLITKCQQLTEGWRARAVNVVAWLTKDVEGRLLPLMNGSADVRRIPQCGRQTTALIEGLLQQLRPYYDELLLNPDTNTATEEVLYTQREVQAFHFAELNTATERRVQAAFSRMMKAVGNTRAKNLLDKHFSQYRDTEYWLNNPDSIWQWFGVGKTTVGHIQQFLSEFKEAYLALTHGTESTPSGNSETDETPLPDLDYPFLTPEEQDFVTTFWNAEKRYPVFYIALRFLQQATDRRTQTFVRVNGINGKHETLAALSEEFGLTFERTRQISKLKVDKAQNLPVWDLDRWGALDFFHKPLLTEANTRWKEIQALEHVEDLSFHSALAILSALLPLEIIALRADGYKANARRCKATEYEPPCVLFAYDSSLNYFSFAHFLRDIDHEAMLQRIEDKSCTLQALTEAYFQPNASEQQRQAILGMLREVIQMLPGVEVLHDTIVFSSNHINYTEDIYQIIARNGKAMTVEEIFAEFKAMHPNDHHTNSAFLRSYMWHDERIEAVGRKSTYQLREWELFSGSLTQLAAHLLKDEAEPLPLTELVRRMKEHRGNTTPKSCESSIYLGFAAGTLQYFFTTEHTASTAYVGLAERAYPAPYWVSTMSVNGAVKSMHRFLTERGHWPYAAASDVVEERLYYILRKFSQHDHVTSKEAALYKQGMADVPPYQYPHNEREAIFVKRCQAVKSFWKEHHRQPTSAEDPFLAKWYRYTLHKFNQLRGFRQYHFKQIRHRSAAKPSQQLSLDFADAD